MTERAGRVEGKVAIVTGAGSSPGPGVGTGKAAAAALAREGARVVVVDLHEDRAADTKRMIEEEGGTAVVFSGDLTRGADCEAMVKAAVDAFGTVDILVNNIGMSVRGSVIELTEEEWDFGLDVNLRTTFLACKYTLPVMIDQGRGSIVNTSSVNALRGYGAAVYATAKGALLALTVDMAYAHGRDGVRVNVVMPGHIFTPFILAEFGEGPRAEFATKMRVQSSFLGTPGSAWDVAAAVTFLASDEASWITGVSLPVDAGVLGASPLGMATDILGMERPKQRPDRA